MNIPQIAPSRTPESKRAAYHAPVLTELGTVSKQTQAFYLAPGTDAAPYSGSILPG